MFCYSRITLFLYKARLNSISEDSICLFCSTGEQDNLESTVYLHQSQVYPESIPIIYTIKPPSAALCEIENRDARYRVINCHQNAPFCNTILTSITQWYAFDEKMGIESFWMVSEYLELTGIDPQGCNLCFVWIFFLSAYF